jgi:HD-GYP domain-containing protein (c-di-GMP phosphodiesterase class II)
LAARIVAACDAYHAMTSDRPYAAAVPKTEAIAELRRCAGSQFDPRVVEHLVAEVEGAPVRPTLKAVDDVADPTPLEPTIDADLAGGLAAAPELDD